MTEPDLDMEDPDIRWMVKRNHFPTEERSLGGALLYVLCDKCGHSWPCKSIQLLRDHKDAVMEDAAKGFPVKSKVPIKRAWKPPLGLSGI